MGKRKEAEKTKKKDKKSKHSKKHKLKLTNEESEETTIVYSLYAVCAHCNATKTVCLRSNQIPEELVAIINSIRVEPGVMFPFKNCSEVVDPEEMTNRILLYHLMDSTSKPHKCFNGLKERKFPEFGLQKKNSRGLLCKKDLFSREDRSHAIVPFLHQVSSNRFTFLAEKTIFVQIMFSVVDEWIKHVGDKTKEASSAPSKKESIDLD
jgi:hypothetical protein